MFQQCWATSDSGKSLRQALEQRGYFLAQGDRRAVVAIDVNGEIYAVARWTGLRNRQVIARFDDVSALPSVGETQARIANLVQEKLTGFAAQVCDEFAGAARDLEARRMRMVERHRAERAELKQTQELRSASEARARAARFRKGLVGLWDRVTGRHAQLRLQNEIEAEAASERDIAQKDDLVRAQLIERQELQKDIRQMRGREAREVSWLQKNMQHFSTRNREPSRQNTSDSFIGVRHRRNRREP